jgi:hypothetical protein
MERDNEHLGAHPTQLRLSPLPFRRSTIARASASVPALNLVLITSIRSPRLLLNTPTRCATCYR